MSSIMGQIKAEHLELFALEFGKMAESDFVYTLSIYKYYPITRRQILDSSKLKEFADNNFKFDENGRKLSRRVENTVEKGEIACYKQFLLFPQCFQKACFPGALKGVIAWEWINQSAPNLVKMYVTIRSRISLIMDLIRPELYE